PGSGATIDEVTPITIETWSLLIWNSPDPPDPPNPADPVMLAQIHAATSLLGLKGPGLAKRALGLLDWYAQNWEALEHLYHRNEEHFKPFQYADLEEAARLGSGLLKQADLSMIPEELARQILDLEQFDDHLLRKAILPGVRLALNVAGAFCPNL